MRDRLRGLAAEQLVQLVLRIAEAQGERTIRLIQESLAALGQAAPRHATAEDAEPFMVGSSAAMQQIYTSIRKFAAASVPLLITGESGTGKELVARAIHERSSHAKGPFVAINCAALPPSLIAAELFGYEKGAFTGAVQRRIGRLESADGGTIFLDEIGDLPLELQAHLLRFLQEHTIDRVGGTRPITVEARVMAATNVDLRRAVAEGRFREDLFYRLNVLNLHLPPLRERGEDVDLIANFFLQRFAKEHGRAVAGFGDDAWQAIRTHRWPGNVRELIGCVRRAVVMADGPWISAADLGIEAAPAAVTATVQAPAPLAAARPRLSVDEAHLRAALREHGDNVSEAARALGVSRMTVYRLMVRFGMRGDETRRGTEPSSAPAA